MNYEIKNVLRKLPKSKSTNLSKNHKVNLSVVTELTNIASTVSVFLKNIEIGIEIIEDLKSKLDSETNSLLVDIEDLSNEAIKLDEKLQEANDLANELGVNPSEFNQYANSLNIWNESMEKISEANSR